jgi:pimeloyl-ACP methyl ester carboxylesterase
VAKTPLIKDSNGNVIPGSIASLEKISIGGLEQWVLIRGRSTHNPILLFLHGGPGAAEWPFVRHYNARLEDHFVIVYWEQRGAGKSYRVKTPNLNVAQFISDTYDLIQYLKKRFNQDKVFLIGHSWGSLVGILIAQKYPELFHAYIGMGQFVSGKENETISYQYLMEAAIKKNDPRAIHQLQKINDPVPYGIIDEKGLWFKNLMTQRDWLFKLGGCVCERTNKLYWIRFYFQAPEYSKLDLIKWVLGYDSSIKQLWPEIMEYDLRKQVPRLEIPVYFLVGRHDYNTPFKLAEEYFHSLTAPEKELIWFDHSAHSPIYEEAEKFNDILIQKVRQKALP